jgi:gluconokinase
MSAPLVVVSGVSGSGKTTVASAVAARLALPFLDADVLHSPDSVAKMRAGTPLDDVDRWPWLDRAGDWLREHDAAGAVLACSALKRSYRDRLRSRAPRALVLQLTGRPDVIASRVAARTGHFMPPSLLASQLATLEPLATDEPGRTIDVGQAVEAIVDDCVAYLTA